MDQLDGMKRWKCPKKHVLGVIQEKLLEQNGRRFHINRLILFREALDQAADIPVDVDVIAVIEDTTMDIECSICEEIRTWYRGDAAMEKLLAQYTGRHALKVE